MRTINIQTIPHSAQRYPTVGDWRDVKDISGEITTEINVSDMGNEDYEFVVAVHELIEQYLCRKRGIIDEAVTEFDKANPDHENPGDIMNAPYHKEHMVATIIETILLHELDIDLVDYQETMLGLYGDKFKS